MIGSDGPIVGMSCSYCTLRQIDIEVEVNKKHYIYKAPSVE